MAHQKYWYYTTITPTGNWGDTWWEWELEVENLAGFSPLYTHVAKGDAQTRIGARWAARRAARRWSKGKSPQKKRGDRNFYVFRV